MDLFSRFSTQKVVWYLFVDITVINISLVQPTVRILIGRPVQKLRGISLEVP
jgi:hypothetical protein